MRTDTIVVGVLILLAGGWLAIRSATGKGTLGHGYYKVQENGVLVSLNTDDGAAALAAQQQAEDAAAAAGQPAPRKTVFGSPARTLGLWIAGFFTLAAFSFLYRDNPCYKIAEHAFVGISAAYYMTVALWTVIVPNLIGKLIPHAINNSLLPGIDLDDTLQKLEVKPWYGFLNYDLARGDGYTAPAYLMMDYIYLIPLVLGIMLLFRLSPKGAWIGRWPLAFILGTTAGIRLIGYLSADFVAQISNAIVPLYSPQWDISNGDFQVWETVRASVSNTILLVGTLCALLYFFFSLEHKGIVGKVSRVGVWVLMITFGAGFGFTVMGRITLLSLRFEFILKEWLHLVGGSPGGA